MLVPNVEEFEGHIGELMRRPPFSPFAHQVACDGTTKSEIVLPLLAPSSSDGTDVVRTIGVLDLDSTILSTFDEEDLRGLQGIVDILRDGCDWL